MQSIGIRLLNATFPTTFPQLRWTPTVLGNALAAWIDMSAGVTQTGNRISQVIDQSPNHLVLSQVTSGFQPLYVASAQNGRPGLQNDSTTAIRGVQAPANDGKTMFGKSVPFSFAVAFIYGASAGVNGKMTFGSMSFTGAPRGWSLETGNNTWNLNLGRRVSFVMPFSGNSTCLGVSATTTPLVVGNKYIVVCTYDGSATPGGITLSINGVNQALQTSFNTLGANDFTINTQQLYVGGVNNAANTNSLSDDTILEAFVSTSKLDSATVNLAAQYFNARYAIY